MHVFQEKGGACGGIRECTLSQRHILCVHISLYNMYTHKFKSMHAYVLMDINGKRVVPMCRSYQSETARYTFNAYFILLHAAQDTNYTIIITKLC